MTDYEHIEAEVEHPILHPASIRHDTWPVATLAEAQYAMQLVGGQAYEVTEDPEVWMVALSAEHEASHSQFGFLAWNVQDESDNSFYFITVRT